MYWISLITILLMSTAQASLYDWEKVEVIDYPRETPSYVTRKIKNSVELSFHSSSLKIPIGLASNIKNKIDQIHYLLNDKSNLPIFSSSRFEETTVNGTCEILSGHREVYLYQKAGDKVQKTLIYKKGNCAYKGKEVSPKHEVAKTNLLIFLNLVKTATDYSNFCATEKK